MINTTLYYKVWFYPLSGFDRALLHNFWCWVTSWDDINGCWFCRLDVMKRPSHRCDNNWWWQVGFFSRLPRLPSTTWEHWSGFPKYFAKIFWNTWPSLTLLFTGWHCRENLCSWNVITVIKCNINACRKDKLNTTGDYITPNTKLSAKLTKCVHREVQVVMFPYGETITRICTPHHCPQVT